jgi:hypothetical protein
VSLQQRIALAALRMQTAKIKKKNYRKKSCYGDLILQTAALTPPRHYHLKLLERCLNIDQGQVLVSET